MRIRLLAILPEKPSSLLSEGRKLCVSWKLIDLRLWTRMKMTLVLLKIMLGIIKGIVKNFSNPVVFALTIAPVTQRFLPPWMACDWLAIFFMSYRYQPTHCCSFKYFARRIHLRFSRLLWPYAGLRQEKESLATKKLLSRLLRMQSITNDLIQYTKSSSLELEWLRPTSQPFFVEEHGHVRWELVNAY